MRPILLLLGIGLLTGCTDTPPVLEGVSRVPVGAVDPELCDQHGVLEVVCAKCNPALAPVFQAKGDWCEEHGFAESFCPICNPGRGGRPVETDLAPDRSPADGTVVRFKTREAATLAGIETATAQSAQWISGTNAPTRLTWDATRVAAVSARSPGIVVSIETPVGKHVQPGTTLARLRSAHVGGDRTRVAAARRTVAVAEAELRRKQDLLLAGVTSERQLLAAEQQVAAAQATLAALQLEVGLVGAGSGDGFVVTSPIAGIVTVRAASVGMSVGPSEALFEVVDVSSMWAQLDVREADLGTVAMGQSVQITLDGLPGRTLDGEISYVAPWVDAKTRTALARVVLDNPDGALRANMYGSARIITGREDAVVTVPSAAVQRAGDVHMVFVREAEDRFVGRRVRVVARSGESVRVAGPIEAGADVATTGSFLLKTETLKDSIGAGCCDVE